VKILLNIKAQKEKYQLENISDIHFILFKNLEFSSVINQKFVINQVKLLTKRAEIQYHFTKIHLISEKYIILKTLITLFKGF